jgi:hypothetical protein
MKELVHTRDISMRTFNLRGHYILVEGRLVDHRYQPRRIKTSEESELVHHMVIQLKVKGPRMLIEQAGAKMPHHPRKECPEMLPWIQNLEGLEIAPGCSMKVKKVIGGAKGCAHLTSLVIAMGESAVQGYWTAHGHGKKKEGSSRTDHQKIHQYLPSLEGGWPYRQRDSREFATSEPVGINKGLAGVLGQGYFSYLLLQSRRIPVERTDKIVDLH